MEQTIGTLIVAAMTIIGFITVFVKVGARFAVMETEIKNLKEGSKEQDKKLDEISNSIKNIEISLAVLTKKGE